MALRKAKDKYAMLPYRKGGPIDYAGLEFDPDVPDWPPDHNGTKQTDSSRRQLARGQVC